MTLQYDVIRINFLWMSEMTLIFFDDSRGTPSWPKKKRMSIKRMALI